MRPAELNPVADKWTALIPHLNPFLHRSLLQNGFVQPTVIQTETLQSNARHICGIAETGSGKTLAFGLPILQSLTLDSDGLGALILSPTRELALQITKQLQLVAMDFSKSVKRLSIVAIVGGLAPEKQLRLLKRQPNVIVATPGRLWDLIQEEKVDVSCPRFVVLDEADKLLHFTHLKSIIDLSKAAKPATYFFSATNSSGIEKLANALRLKNLVTVDVKPELLSRPALLQESKIFCTLEDKDLVLYSLLRNRPGRTLVFVNAIAILNRLAPLFKALDFPVCSIHANMVQKQRLRHLDRFKASSDSVLFASDVASRGLDVFNVDFVVHYHVPKSSELYVHRCGRTARAGASGLSVLLVSPREIGDFNNLTKDLNISLPDHNFLMSSLAHLRPALHVAKQIEELQNKIKKHTNDSRWRSKAAKAFDIIEDEEESVCVKPLQEQLSRLLASRK